MLWLLWSFIVEISHKFGRTLVLLDDPTFGAGLLLLPFGADWVDTFVAANKLATNDVGDVTPILDLWLVVVPLIVKIIMQT